MCLESRIFRDICCSSICTQRNISFNLKWNKLLHKKQKNNFNIKYNAIYMWNSNIRTLTSIYNIENVKSFIITNTVELNDRTIDLWLNFQFQIQMSLYIRRLHFDVSFLRIVITTELNSWLDILKENSKCNLRMITPPMCEIKI